MKQNSKNAGCYTGNILQNQFTAYVEKALRNNRVSFFRKRQFRLENELLFSSDEEISLHTQDVEASADFSDSDFHSKELTHALDLISDKDKSIIKMRVLYEYPYSKIAELTGTTPGAARVRYIRAIAKIRKRLEAGK